jgi:ferredoxin
MKIIVDTDLCSGHGRCAAVSSGVFTLDDTGFNEIREMEVGPDDEAAARTGANNCPERAITIVD